MKTCTISDFNPLLFKTKSTHSADIRGHNYYKELFSKTTTIKGDTFISMSGLSYLCLDQTSGSRSDFTPIFPSRESSKNRIDGLNRSRLSRNVKHLQIKSYPSQSAP